MNGVNALHGAVLVYRFVKLFITNLDNAGLWPAFKATVVGETIDEDA